jgi:hypothetical protein
MAQLLTWHASHMNIAQVMAKMQEIGFKFSLEPSKS